MLKSARYLSRYQLLLSRGVSGLEGDAARSVSNSTSTVLRLFGEGKTLDSIARPASGLCFPAYRFTEFLLIA